MYVRHKQYKIFTSRISPPSLSNVRRLQIRSTFGRRTSCTAVFQASSSERAHEDAGRLESASQVPHRAKRRIEKRDRSLRDDIKDGTVIGTYNIWLL